MSSTSSRPTATRIRPWRDAGGLALLFGQAAVRGGGRMGDGRLGVAEVGGDRADLGRVDHVEGVRARRRGVAAAGTSNDTTAPPCPTAGHRQRMLRMRLAGPGSTRARPPAALRASRASASARSLCACMRIDKRLQALQHHPGVERRQRHAGAAQHRHELLVDELLAGAQIAPAITRPWPSRYLVPEWMTRSAPNSTGRCSAGEQKQLSTASSAPASCAMSASARMSQTSVSGLVGVSANSSLVFGRTAARHCGDVGLRDEGGLDAELGELAAEQLDRRAEHAAASRSRGRRPSAGPCTAAGSRSCRWRCRCRPRCLPARPGGARTSSPSGW